MQASDLRHRFLRRLAFDMTVNRVEPYRDRTVPDPAIPCVPTATVSSAWSPPVGLPNRSGTFFWKDWAEVDAEIVADRAQQQKGTMRFIPLRTMLGVQIGREIRLKSPDKRTD